jgi:hypothetical protein
MKELEVMMKQELFDQVAYRAWFHGLGGWITA